MGTALPLVIAGAGIAGLTAALAAAGKGYRVELFERAPHLLELGAGLQVSPNASRILARLGVLDRLGDSALRPRAIRILDASTGRTLAMLPLGQWAQARWGAPYLVAHRADLQNALLDAVRNDAGIDLQMGVDVTGAHPEADGLAIDLSRSGDRSRTAGAALIAADGVWSDLRRELRGQEPSGFSGFVAWRSTLSAAAGEAGLFERDLVHVFVHPRFHLVAYPLRGGALINLVGILRGGPIAESWAHIGEPLGLSQAMAGTVTAPVVSATNWTCWPIHEVDSDGPWVSRDRIALIGDAAHAMSPYSAQGAAMAIEDAHVLAECLPRPEAAPEGILRALRRYEARRKPRIRQVRQRTQLNRLAWHAPGPLALARNIVLSLRGGERMMRDLDWLYGVSG